MTSAFIAFFLILPASCLIALSPEIPKSFNMHVPFSLSWIVTSG
jgi:hypothetical protein